MFGCYLVDEGFDHFIKNFEPENDDDVYMAALRAVEIYDKKIFHWILDKYPIKVEGAFSISMIHRDLEFSGWLLENGHDDDGIDAIYHLLGIERDVECITWNSEIEKCAEWLWEKKFVNSELLEIVSESLQGLEHMEAVQAYNKWILTKK
jgi:hypothetical protein